MKRKIFTITLIIASLVLAGCGIDTGMLAGSIDTVIVPDVVGLSADDAESKLTNADFVVEKVLVDSTEVPANVVVSTDPPADTQAEAFSTVKLFVAKGSQSSVKVPDVIGKSLEDAKKELASVGLQLGDTRYKGSEEAKDTVLLTNPLPGASVDSGSKVDLTLSSGKPKERTLKIEVPTPASDGDIKLTVYVDGELDQSTLVDPGKSSVTFTFRGSKGTKEVKIKANGQSYKEYTLDFDKGRVIEK